jgi:hypothetical protein
VGGVFDRQRDASCPGRRRRRTSRFAFGGVLAVIGFVMPCRSQ